MSHPRTDDWVIYPTYDFAHGQSDAIEHITHSVCTLEFEDHRPLYDWFIENLNLPSRPKQYEFSRLNLDYTVMSKRALSYLVDNNLVSGWDDPRMPTIRGMRRRGYPASAIRDMCDLIGVTKKDTVTKLSFLEECVRKQLDNAPRLMAVLNPLKVVITNYDKEEVLTPSVHPKKPELGKRKLTFSNQIFIEKDDFMQNPTEGFHRLSPGKKVRLRYAYVIKCDEVIKNKDNEIVELRCSYFPETKSGKPMSNGEKVKGIIHWVSSSQNQSVEVRLYDRLFLVERPGKDFIKHINPESLKIIENVKVENTKIPRVCQFERTGFFCMDDSLTSSKIILNKTVSLRSSF